MAEGPGFIHLNCHSAYSLLEGALPLATLVKLAAEDGMPAVGVTDTANLFGASGVFREGGRRRHPADHRLQAAGPLRAGAGVRGPRRAGPQRRSRHVAPLFLLGATEEGYRGADKARDAPSISASRAARSRCRSRPCRPRLRRA